MSTLRQNPFGQMLESSPAGSRVATPTMLEEKREFQRAPSSADLWLLDLEGLTVLRSQADNIGSGGLHTTVPIGYGLAVGQRYELRIRPLHAPVAPGRPGWAACYGTIIRTRLMTERNHDRLGVAIRFDTPQAVPHA